MPHTHDQTFTFGPDRHRSRTIIISSGDNTDDDMGDEFRLHRVMGGADLRLVVLLLLEEEPRHGYDLIKVIEDRSAQAYSPSPGVIYPALTWLVEAGYADSSKKGNRKIYRITEEGAAHLEENRDEAQAILDGLKHLGEQVTRIRKHVVKTETQVHTHNSPRPDRDIPNVIDEVNQARRALKAAISTAIKGDKHAQQRLADILQRAADEIAGDDIDIG